MTPDNDDDGDGERPVWLPLGDAPRDPNTFVGDWFDGEVETPESMVEELPEETFEAEYSVDNADVEELEDDAQCFVNEQGDQGPEAGDEATHETASERQSASTTTTAAAANAGDYFFYQSSDGQRLFLHSVNVKCLAFEYGTINAAPTAISGRVLQIDEGIVTEGLRKRCRYLSTLPIHCPFKVRG